MIDMRTGMSYITIKMILTLKPIHIVVVLDYDTFSVLHSHRCPKVGGSTSVIRPNIGTQQQDRRYVIILRPG
jgi:hypothetical protein